MASDLFLPLQIIVHKEGGLRTVNFIVEKPSKRNVGPYVLAQEPS